MKIPRRAPRTMKRTAYPEPFSHLPRVQGIAYRADRDQWRVRLYSGSAQVIFDQHFPDYEAAVAGRGRALDE